MLRLTRNGPKAIGCALRQVAAHNEFLQRRVLYNARDASHRTFDPQRTRPRLFHTGIRRHVAQAAQVELEPEGEEEPLMENTSAPEKFSELAERGLVDRQLVSNITDKMGLSTMTEVQSATILESLEGKDLFAHAKTGTGKTLGFLIPVLQKILPSQPRDAQYRGRNASSSDIRGLIISPTRELAEQIATEARKVVDRTGLRVQSAVGGVGKSFAMRKMHREGCHLLVGTPGRLLDLLSDPASGVSCPNLDVLVLDEADRMLDDGFYREVSKIVQKLPDPEEKDRQTLMFSATTKREVMGMVQRVMKRGYRMVSTVKAGEPLTHERVPQTLVEVNGFENMLPTLLELCKREVKRSSEPGREPFKAIVYFNQNANVMNAFSTLLNARSSNRGLFGPPPAPSPRIFQMHARLSQEKRTHISKAFRESDSAILLSSDVTARGMDFPNVTHVIQMGVPANFDTYVHRLGRTARAHKTGEGWVLVPGLDRRSLRYALRDLRLQEDTSLQTAKVDMSKPAELPDEVAKGLSQISEARSLVSEEEKREAWLAELQGHGDTPKKRQMLEAMTAYARHGFGWDELPAVPFLSARAMGMVGMEGIRVGDGGARKDFGNSRDSRDFRSPRREQFGREEYGRDRPRREQFGREEYGRDRPRREQFGREEYGRDKPRREAPRFDRGSRSGSRNGRSQHKSHGERQRHSFY